MMIELLVVLPFYAYISSIGRQPAEVWDTIQDIQQYEEVWRLPRDRIMPSATSEAPWRGLIVLIPNDAY